MITAGSQVSGVDPLFCPSMRLLTGHGEPRGRDLVVAVGHDGCYRWIVECGCGLLNSAMILLVANGGHARYPPAYIMIRRCNSFVSQGPSRLPVSGDVILTCTYISMTRDVTLQSPQVRSISLVDENLEAL